MILVLPDSTRDKENWQSNHPSGGSVRSGSLNSPPHYFVSLDLGTERHQSDQHSFASR